MNHKEIDSTIIEKVHPEYDENRPQWDFFDATYKGGKIWFDKNIFKYIKEGDDEYKERKERAYRFNHTREVVDLVNKYIFKAEISRKEDAEDYVKDFWSNATLQKRDVDHFMQMASGLASILGRIWIVIDNNFPQDKVSVADAKKSGGRVYCYTVMPQDILDLSFSEDGELNWIKIRETKRDDDDPFNYSGLSREMVRIWTRDSWYLYEQRTGNTGNKTYELTEEGTHDLGIVPVTYLDHHETENYYTSTPLIAEIAYMDKAVANYLSNLDAIIQDQTFSQLVIPAEALAFTGGADDDDEGENLGQKLLEFGTKRIFLYSGEAANKPDFISPDPKQAGVILGLINKIISEIYHSVGMAGERTKTDNATGIDNSSGVAKAYDFERMNAMLANKAKSLEFCENRMIRIVKAYYSDTIHDLNNVEEYVTYSRDFDVRNLSNEFDIANNLSIINAPKTLRQEQMNNLVDKLYPQLSKQLKDEISKDVKDNWLAEPTAQEIAAMGLPKAPLPKQSGSQGQNNKPAEK